MKFAFYSASVAFILCLGLSLALDNNSSVALNNGTGSSDVKASAHDLGDKVGLNRVDALDSHASGGAKYFAEAEVEDYDPIDGAANEDEEAEEEPLPATNPPSLSEVSLQSASENLPLAPDSSPLAPETPAAAKLPSALEGKPSHSSEPQTPPPPFSFRPVPSSVRRGSSPERGAPKPPDKTTIIIEDYERPSKWVSREFIDEINAEQTYWRAGRNFRADATDEQLLRLVARDLEVVPRPFFTVLRDLFSTLIPNLSALFLDYLGFRAEDYDGRKSWCERGPQDTGVAATSWALATTAALQERACMLKGKRYVRTFSADYMIDCCRSCEKVKLRGGTASNAYEFMKLVGVPSKECAGYRMRPIMDKLGPDTKGGSISQEERLKGCRAKCDNGDPIPADRLYKVEDYYYVTPAVPTIVRREIMRGALTAEVTIFTDFLNYKEGVYTPSSRANYLGTITVRLIGWGTEMGVSYWQAAGIWGQEFGDRGYVKFRASDPKLEIETRITAAKPLLEPEPGPEQG